MPGPLPVPIVLTVQERRVLESGERRPKTSQALATRSRIVLACASERTNGQVASVVGVSVATVVTWRGRFAKDRLEGLVDEPRPGRPRTVSDEQVHEVITKTLEAAPSSGDTHRSTRSMAKATGLSSGPRHVC